MFLQCSLKDLVWIDIERQRVSHLFFFFWLHSDWVDGSIWKCCTTPFQWLDCPHKKKKTPSLHAYLKYEHNLSRYNYLNKNITVTYFPWFPYFFRLHTVNLKWTDPLKDTPEEAKVAVSQITTGGWFQKEIFLPVLLILHKPTSETCTVWIPKIFFFSKWQLK